MSSKKSSLALVLSGGGARGAYEAGVVHYIRQHMNQTSEPPIHFEVLCGSSVGAINTAFLAATSHDLKYQGEEIVRLWQNLKQENVYRRDVAGFTNLILKSITGITKNLFSGVDSKKNTRNHFSGLLNTQPLSDFLRTHVPWNQLAVNVATGVLKAVSMTATNVYTGKLELFVERHSSVAYTGRYIFHDTHLGVEHVMASAALPLIFPSVRVGQNYYTDGGLRLNTPMSPAIQLGSDKILVIGLHHIDESAEENERTCEVNPKATNPPSMGLMVGKVLSSIFLDRLDYDIEQMQRINRVIEWGEGRFGSDFVEQINTYLANNNIRGDIAARGLKKLRAFRITPSRDMRDIFMECVNEEKIFSSRLTTLERFLLKVLDVDVYSGRDVLSFMMFNQVYLSRLADLGFEDAKKQHTQLEAFLRS